MSTRVRVLILILREGAIVKYLVRPWRRPVARVLVLALILGVVPMYCFAGEPPKAPSASPSALSASIDRAVRSEAANIGKVAPRALQQTGTTAVTRSSPGGFFKTKAGIVSMVLLAAGTGFAIYSVSHDRVSSAKVPYGGTWK